MAELSNAQDLNDPMGDPDAIQEDVNEFRTNNEQGSHDNGSFDSIMFEPFLNSEANPDVPEPDVPDNNTEDAPNRDITAANPPAHIEVNVDLSRQTVRQPPAISRDQDRRSNTNSLTSHRGSLQSSRGKKPEET
ncbi:hypothetical protein QAD02_007300 [Eretmocerus hayati]|uniref:Uncharacterized protein n=1 Tax=Eretmocerus hayati TaxID=131215 RepID=A0ACC2N3T9_9HYME|nr:hypothetical protein QAD02_007300 [Eretmocerus hayati]